MNCSRIWGRFHIHASQPSSSCWSQAAVYIDILVLICIIWFQRKKLYIFRHVWHDCIHLWVSSVLNILQKERIHAFYYMEMFYKEEAFVSPRTFSPTYYSFGSRSHCDLGIYLHWSVSILKSLKLHILNERSWYTVTLLKRSYRT